MSQQLLAHFWFILLLKVFTRGEKLSLYGFVRDMFKMVLKPQASIVR